MSIDVSILAPCVCWCVYGVFVGVGMRVASVLLLCAWCWTMRCLCVCWCVVGVLKVLFWCGGACMCQ